MTDPNGGAPNPEVPVPAEPAGALPTEPAAAPPAATPAPPPAAAAPPPAGGNWQTPPPPAQPAEPAPQMQVPQQFQPVAAAAGPAPGVAYADLVTRLIAFVIDAVLLWIVMVFVGIALGALLFGFLLGGGFFLALIAAVLLSVASLAVSAAYFVWGWTNPSMRASLGQRALGLNTVNALDGATLTREQAVRRWFFLYGLLAVASVLQTTLGASDISFLGPLIGLLSLAYVVFLIWTTSKDAKRQGFHDIKASTVVVKRVA
jgi:uncharacterized RDD family membrane protein YckC